MSKDPDPQKTESTTLNQEIGQAENVEQTNTRTAAAEMGGSTSNGIGESAGRAFDSARKTLSEPEPKNQLIFGIGLFAVIGGGFGLTGIFAVSLIIESGSGLGSQFVSAMLLISILGVLLLTGPIIGAFIGVRIGDHLNRNNHTIYLTSFVANAAGYLVMVIVALLLLSLALGGGNGSNTGNSNLFSLADLFIPLVILAIPVGITGIGASYLTQ